VRFQRVFGEFLKAAAQPAHPLVLFLDDLQWADPSTPELLVSLLSDEDLKHLLVIGSYRDNEVREGHLLLTAIGQIREERPEAVLEISLLPLTDVLVHAFRNSMDHGIEPRAEREALGKAPQGRIAVHGGRAGNRITVRISDDGAGLRLDRLREKTSERDASDEDLANRASSSRGISTAATQSQVSGRGVGLDAVRTFMRKNGGDARVAFTGAAREGCVPFELVLDLPEDAGTVEPRPSMPPAQAFAAG